MKFKKIFLTFFFAIMLLLSNVNLVSASLKRSVNSRDEELMERMMERMFERGGMFGMMPMMGWFGPMNGWGLIWMILLLTIAILIIILLIVIIIKLLKK